MTPHSSPLSEDKVAVTVAQNQKPDSNCKTSGLESDTVVSLAARRRASLALSALLAVISGIAGLIPYYLVYLIALEIVGKSLGEVDAFRIWMLAGTGVAAVIIKTLCYTYALHLSHITAYKILYDARLALARKMATLPMGYFNDRTTGQVKRVIHEDVEQLEEGLAHMVPDFAMGITVPIATIAILFAVDWRMAAISVMTLVLAIATYGALSAQSGAWMNRWQEMQARMNGIVLRYINGRRLLRHSHAPTSRMPS